MNNQEQKKIRAIAKILPARLYGSCEWIEIKGRDLLLAGTKEVEGKKVDPEKEYYMKSPVYIEENHYRRMKKLFIVNGPKGLEGYIKAFLKSPVKAGIIIGILFK